MYVKGRSTRLSALTWKFNFIWDDVQEICFLGQIQIKVSTVRSIIEA